MTAQRPLLTFAGSKPRRPAKRASAATSTVQEDIHEDVARARSARSCSRSSACAANAAYPERPITLIVPWGAGGGTDAVARFFGAYLEKELGQPVNVVNRTGGNGVVGHSAIAQAQPDGYTIGLITVEITMMHWQGLTELGPTSYQPLRSSTPTPPASRCAPIRPGRSVKDVIDAVKANPGKHKASGTGQGGIWHLAIAGLLTDLKIDPAAVPWVPSNGAAPDCRTSSPAASTSRRSRIPEARSLIDAGKVQVARRVRRQPARAVSEPADGQAGRSAATGRRRRGAASRRRRDCRRTSPTA